MTTTAMDRLRALQRRPGMPAQLVGALDGQQFAGMDEPRRRIDPRYPVIAPVLRDDPPLRRRAPPAAMPAGPQTPPPPQPPAEQPQGASGLMSAFGSPMVQQGLLGLGMGMLEAAGPQTGRASFSNAMASGLRGMDRQMQQQYGNQLADRAMGLREQQVEMDNAAIAAEAQAQEEARATAERLMASPQIPDAVKAMGLQAVMNYATTHAEELAKVPETQSPTSLQRDLIAAGLEPGTPAFRRAMLQARLPQPDAAPSVHVTTGNTGPQIGTIPQGFQLVETPTGYRMEPIPGGPADLEQQEAVEREQAAEETQQRTGSIVLQDTGRALDILRESPDLVSGAVGYASQMLPGTPAFKMNEALKTIKSRIGFNELQAMRESSPTGGALGNVTIGELERLESVYGNLSLGQSPEALEANLKRIDNIFADVVYGTPEQIQAQVEAGAISPEAGARLSQRHDLPFNERGRPVETPQQSQGAAPQGPTVVPDDIEELLQRYGN